MAGDLTLGVVLGASLGATWNKTIKAGKTDLSALGQEIQKTTKLQSSVKNAASLQVEMKGTRQALAASRIEAEKLRLQFDMASREGSKGAKQVGAAYERAKAKTARLTETLAKQQTRLEGVNASLKKAGVETRDLSRANEKLGETLQKQNAAFLKQKKLTEDHAALMDRRAAARDDLTSHVSMLAIPGVVAGKSIGTAINFEAAMADVNKVVNFKTAAEARAMGDAIQYMATQMPMAAEGIASIVAFGGQAQIPKKDLLDFASDAVKMGVAFDVTADDAGMMMATWRSGLNLTADQVRNLADQINYLGNTGPVSADKIAAIVTRIGALGDVAGLDAGAVAALGASLTTVAPEVASTGIKALSVALTQGNAATAKQRAAFKALGLDSVKVAKDMQKNAPKALLDVFTRLKALPKFKQGSILSELFNREAAGTIAPLLSNLDLLQANLGKVADKSKYAGSMQAEYASIEATTKSQLKELGGSFSALGNVLGRVFLPVLRAGANLLGGLINGIVAVANAMPLLTNVVVAAASGWALYTTAVKFAALANTYMPASLLGMTGSLGKLGTALRLAGSGWLLAGQRAIIGGVMMMSTMSGIGVAFAATGIGAIIIGIAVAGLLIYKYWQPIKAFFGGMFGGMKAAALDFFAPVMPLFHAIGNVIGWVVDKFKAWLAPVDATSATLGRAASAGQSFGKIMFTALKIAFFPLTGAMWLLGKIIDGVKWVGSSWLGKKLGISAEAPDTASSGGNVVDIASVRNAKMASAGSAQQNSYKIDVHPSPGMNEEQLAQLVSDKIAEQQRAADRRQRSSMYDVG